MVRGFIPILSLLVEGSTMEQTHTLTHLYTENTASHIHSQPLGRREGMREIFIKKDFFFTSKYRINLLYTTWCFHEIQITSSFLCKSAKQWYFNEIDHLYL